MLCHLRFPYAIINDNLIESLWDLDSVGLASTEVNVDDKILYKLNDSIFFRRPLSSPTALEEGWGQRYSTL